MLAAGLTTPPPVSEIRVLAWNIWRGGNEAMDANDPMVKAQKQRQIVDAIKRSKADVVAMVETYGSGEVIAQGLKYSFHPRGTNVSLLSRWPIEKDLSVYKPFNCVGAKIRLPGGRGVDVYSVWIHYVDDIWTDPNSRDGRSADDLLAKDGDSRRVEISEILAGIESQTKGDPVILAGDFNSNSHLDYVESAKKQFGVVVPWPVTKKVMESGFYDSYRECNRRIDRTKDRTWSPKFPEQIQDRIDFIFWKGNTIEPKESKVIDRAKGGWPSDHAAILTTFSLKDK